MPRASCLRHAAVYPRGWLKEHTIVVPSGGLGGSPNSMVGDENRWIRVWQVSSRHGFLESDAPVRAKKRKSGSAGLPDREHESFIRLRIHRRFHRRLQIRVLPKRRMVIAPCGRTGHRVLNGTDSSDCPVPDRPLIRCQCFH